MKKIQLCFLMSICFVVLLSVSGCSYSIGPTSATTPLASPSDYTVIGNTKGSSTSFSFLFIPIGTNTPLRNALQSALKQKQADALIDVEADHFAFNFLFIFGIYTTEVRGKAIKMNSKSERTQK